MAIDQQAWRTSSYSEKIDCVEVAPLPGATGVRDSKDRDGGELRVPRASWCAFVRSIRGLSA